MLHLRGPSSLVLLPVAVLALACVEHPRPLAAPGAPQRSDTILYVTVSDPNPPAGSTITVTAMVAPRAGLKAVGSFKARLTYDSTGLTFLQEGKLPTGMRVLNPRLGRIIAAGAAAEGFQDRRLFAVTFKVQRPAALGSIELSVEELNGTDFANQLPPVHERSVRLTAPQRQM